jgi:pyrroline-5-carboxylate reductase
MFKGWPAVSITSDNRRAVAEADVVLLSVRPQDLDVITLDLRGKLVISVMALVSVAELERRFASPRIIRAMPNAAAARGLSYSPYFPSSDATAEDIAFTHAFLGATGLAERVDDEDVLNYLTGLTGSGPAFFAALAAAMEKDAVSRGLASEMAGRAIRQLLRGAAAELSSDGLVPDALVQVFRDYRGTTAAGLEAMEKAGLADVVRAMLRAAEEKAAGLT